jgi:hypothetical protein
MSDIRNRLRRSFPSVDIPLLRFIISSSTLFLGMKLHLSVYAMYVRKLLQHTHIDSFTNTRLRRQCRDWKIIHDLEASQHHQRLNRGQIRIGRRRDGVLGSHQRSLLVGCEVLLLQVFWPRLHFYRLRNRAGMPREGS